MGASRGGIRAGVDVGSGKPAIAAGNRGGPALYPAADARRPAGRFHGRGGARTRRAGQRGHPHQQRHSGDGRGGRRAATARHHRRVDGTPVTDYPSLVSALRGKRAGDTVEVTFYRGPDAAPRHDPLRPPAAKDPSHTGRVGRRDSQAQRVHAQPARGDFRRGARGAGARPRRPRASGARCRPSRTSSCQNAIRTSG